MSADLDKQRFLAEFESIVEDDEAYGSNISVLNYTIKDGVISGKFRDSWNNRVYEFEIDSNSISYKPAINLDSANLDSESARHFDLYSNGYNSLFADRQDGKLTGKRVKKPKCGSTAYGCGFSCIGLKKTCRILGRAGKKAGTNQGSAIGKERLVKLVGLAKKLNSEGDKTEALAVYTKAKNLKTERDKYTSIGNERKAERTTEKEAGRPINKKTKFDTTHDLIPLREAIEEWNNFKHPEVINKISTITGMTTSEARASAKAVNAFTHESYERIRKAEYGGIETPQVKAINRYLDKMPKFSGEIFRGKNFKTQQDVDNFVKKLQDGQAYELPAMSSFSSNKETALTFAKEGALGLLNQSFASVVFKVTGNKSGVTVKYLSANVEEDEVLVKKGARYKINGTIETVKHLGKEVTIIPLKEY